VLERDNGNFSSTDNGKVIGESFTLTVEGPPVVSAVKMDEEYYLKGREVVVQFTVISHPPPNKREWYCSPCYYKGAGLPFCDRSQSDNCIVSIICEFAFLAYYSRQVEE